MENQKFKKILTEKEYVAIAQYMKAQPVAWQYYEPVLNSLLQLPDAENKKKEAK